MGIFMPIEVIFLEINIYLEIISLKSLKSEEQVTDFYNEIIYSLIACQFLLSTSLPDIDLDSKKLGIDLGVEDIRIKNVFKLI